MLKQLLLRCLPHHWRSALGTYRVLAKQGHVRSARARECVDAAGKPIPWYTYPALEYLRSLDWSDKTVFEYGAGNSTLFWCSVAKYVEAVESDRAWFDRIAATRIRCALSYAADKQRYIEAIQGPFDVIVVDGENRLQCARHARPFLKPGGLMILDNADWHITTAQFLRDSGLLEVDFTGFGPINGYAWTTSFFFSRDFSPQPANGHLPCSGIGAVVHRAD